MPTVIDATQMLKSTPKSGECATKIVSWRSHWDELDGEGVTVGLIDGPVDATHADLVDSDLTVRRFGVGIDTRPQAHAVSAASMLVGQGRISICGLAPRAKLLVATIIGAHHCASPDSLVEAIDWLLTEGADLIACPLGVDDDPENAAAMLRSASQTNTVIFAAAGNVHPAKVLFPARHESCVAVGALDSHGRLLGSCARNPTLDLCAAGMTSGVRIPALAGSSMACMNAVGAAVLEVSFHGSKIERAALLAAMSAT